MTRKLKPLTLKYSKTICIKIIRMSNYFLFKKNIHFSEISILNTFMIFEKYSNPSWKRKYLFFVLNQIYLNDILPYVMTVPIVFEIIFM